MALATSNTCPLLLAAFLLFLKISLSSSVVSDLVPDQFACTAERTAQSGIYSTATPPQLRFDLIHILCGDIGPKGRPGGFHARPGDMDPPSASTADSELIRQPRNVYDFAVYKDPQVWSNKGCNPGFIVKKGRSGIWPTALSYEGIVWIVTTLVEQCSPPLGKNLCVRGVSLLANSMLTSVPAFDVVIIIQQSSVIRTAYPVDTGECAKSDATFHQCNFQFPKQYPDNLLHAQP